MNVEKVGERALPPVILSRKSGFIQRKRGHGRTGGEIICSARPQDELGWAVSP